mmetsp:Transcript_15049/g.23416  ORF Transcript_15049/g.23416 Transcript_15049/m.23416 type:complete len:124 (-) Transcript_15049:108-479(-)
MTRILHQFGAFGSTIDTADKIVSIAKRFGKTIVVHANCIQGCCGCYRTMFLTKTNLGNVYELGAPAKAFLASLEEDQEQSPETSNQEQSVEFSPGMWLTRAARTVSIVGGGATSLKMRSESHR